MINKIKLWGLSMVNLNRLAQQYKKIYGESIDFLSWSEEDANKMLEWCSEQRERILLESHFNSYLNNKDYAKIIILESLARQILKEIAPKRIKKKGIKKNG
jgi:hypothetical protein